MLCIYMNGKVFVMFNRNCFPKMKYVSRLGSHVQAVTYTVKVVASKIVQDRHAVTTHH